MKCIICHGQNIEESSVEEELRIGSDIVFVPVQARVCRSCGERYFTSQAIRQLEKIEEQIKLNQPTLREIGKVLVYE